MLFLAATSLAVRGSGSDVGMGDFWRNEQENSVTERIIEKLELPRVCDLQGDLALDNLFQLI